MISSHQDIKRVQNSEQFLNDGFSGSNRQIAFSWNLMVSAWFPISGENLQQKKVKQNGEDLIFIYIQSGILIPEKTSLFN